MTADNPEKKKNSTKELVEWSISILLAIAFAMGIHTWVGQLITVDGPSMEPNLLTGERVLVGKVEYWFHKPKRGDIVLVRYPGSSADYIKRVVAVSGETVSIIGGQTMIDGKALDEPYVQYPPYAELEPVIVPDGSLFVMGDNRANSTDSRDPVVGAIPLNHVVGRAYLLVWPLGDAAKLTDYSGKLEQ